MNSQSHNLSHLKMCKKPNWFSILITKNPQNYLIDICITFCFTPVARVGLIRTSIRFNAEE